jgi:protein SCO1/2
VPSPTSNPSPPRPTSDVGRGARRASIAAVALIAAGAVAWLLIPAQPLPLLGEVPPFTLTERSGQMLAASDLTGHVWVADFVFTHCPDICLALTARMASLQKALTSHPVRLVSFSVDPAHDTPEVLRDYATRFGARDGWFFVTGPREAVSTLLRDGFKVAWADDGPPTSPITHSDRFVLVDRALQIRGYYHGNEPDDMDRLTRDAIALSEARTSGSR